MDRYLLSRDESKKARDWRIERSNSADFKVLFMKFKEEMEKKKDGHDKQSQQD
jgi:hypothetical protein